MRAAAACSFAVGGRTQWQQRALGSAHRRGMGVPTEREAAPRPPRRAAPRQPHLEGLCTALPPAKGALESATSTSDLTEFAEEGLQACA